MGCGSRGPAPALACWGPSASTGSVLAAVAWEAGGGHPVKNSPPPGAHVLTGNRSCCSGLCRLLTLRYVSTASVVGWVFGGHGLSELDQPLRTLTAWELLYMAVNKAIARVGDAAEELAEAVAAAEAVEARAAAGEMGGDVVRQVDLAEVADVQRARAVEAREAAEKLGAAMEANHRDRDETLLAAYRCFVEWVAAQQQREADAAAARSGDTEMEAAEGGSAQGQHQQALAHLRAFARTYFAESAELVPELLEDIVPAGGGEGEGGVPQDVRQALLGALRLPLTED